MNKSAYAAQSAKVNGILYYTGRILCNQGIEGAQTLGDACFDLSKATFRVPLSDAMSPIAHAVTNKTHWYHADVKHTGVESVLSMLTGLPL